MKVRNARASLFVAALLTAALASSVVLPVESYAAPVVATGKIRALYKKGKSKLPFAKTLRFIPGSAVMDFLKHGQKVEIFYKSGDSYCVRATTKNSHREVTGWVFSKAVRQIHFKQGRRRVPAVPRTGRECDYHTRRRCNEVSCHEDRPDNTCGDGGCGTSAFDDPSNPCVTLQTCRLRVDRSPLLYDPGLGETVGNIVLDRKKGYRKVYATDKCRRLGLLTGFDGDPAKGPSESVGNFEYVLVHLGRRHHKWSPKIVGWIRRDHIFCPGDPPDQLPASCTPLPPPVCGAAAVSGLGSAAAAAECSFECCDGAMGAFSASDAEDCLEDVFDFNQCGGGDCSVRGVSFSGTAVFSQECRSCCVSCTRSGTAYHVTDACDNCSEESDDYCRMQEAGRPVDIVEAPWGQCPDKPPGDCVIQCCDGAISSSESRSRNECFLDAGESDVCAEDECGAGTQRISFNAEELFVGDCDKCCALCNNLQSYDEVPGVCAGCTDEAEAYCNTDNRGGLVDAAWGNCAILPTPTPTPVPTCPPTGSCNLRGTLAGICWANPPEESAIVTIDETTGTQTTVACSGFPGLNSLARNSAGTLLSAVPENIFSQVDGWVQITPRLLTIDPDGCGVLPLAVLDFGTVSPDVRGLAFSPSDTLFAINHSGPLGGSYGPHELYVIDISTGVGTRIGETPPSIQSISFAPSGTLYAWDVDLGLMTIDPATGQALDVNLTVPGTNFIQAIAFSSDGRLFGAGNGLFEIDLATGVNLPISSGGACDVRGIEFVSP